MCGAIYVVLSPPRPVIQRVETKPPAHVLPYEQGIARTREAPAQDSAAMDAAAPASATEADVKAAPDQAVPKPDAQPAVPASGAQQNAGNPGAGMPPNENAEANGEPPLPPDDAGAHDQAALPPGDGSGQYDGSGHYDVTAVPPGAAPPGSPYGNALDGYGSPPNGPYGPPHTAYGPPQKGPPLPQSYEDSQQGGPYGQDGPYGQGAPYGQPPQDGQYGEANQGAPDGQLQQGGPYGQAPDDSAQGMPRGPQEEWVQVLVSGAGMYGTASEDAPMLFAFPYGRRLKVVSHYEGWVEVTDPQSATTGWMKVGHVAPAAAPGAPPQQVDTSYEEERPGWFRRRGGLGDIISRALGGF
jgi:hypothetical protein